MKGDNKKVAFGFPLVESKVASAFFLTFSAMQKPSEYTLLVPEIPHGSFDNSITTARNSIVKQAIEGGYDYLFMMDTDQVYPSNTFVKLMEDSITHNAPVCCIYVHRRYPPYEPILLRGELGQYKHVPDEECFSGGLVPVDATGAAGMLLDMSIFNTIKEPWFEFSKTDKGAPVGEDIFFCHKLRKAGIPIFVDTSVKVGHIIEQVVDRTFYQTQLEIAKIRMKANKGK